MTCIPTLKHAYAFSLPLPQDANLAWLAANFMAQDHPLVAAMRAQVGSSAMQASHAMRRRRAEESAAWQRGDGQMHPALPK